MDGKTGKATKKEKKEIWKYKRGEKGRRETDQREWTEVSAFTVQTLLQTAITLYISWRFFPTALVKLSSAF